MVVINIDTSKDSKEEIRKTIAYLESLLRDEEKGEATETLFSNPFEEPTDSSAVVGQASSDGQGAGLFGMFDAGGEQESTETDETKPSADELLKEDFIEVESEDDTEVEVVDEQADTVVEIVEYE